MDHTFRRRCIISVVDHRVLEINLLHMSVWINRYGWRQCGDDYSLFCFGNLEALIRFMQNSYAKSPGLCHWNCGHRMITPMPVNDTGNLPVTSQTPHCIHHAHTSWVGLCLHWVIITNQLKSIFQQEDNDHASMCLSNLASSFLNIEPAFLCRASVIRRGKFCTVIFHRRSFYLLFLVSNIKSFVELPIKCIRMFVSVEQL